MRIYANVKLRIDQLGEYINNYTLVTVVEESTEMDTAKE